MPSAGDVVLASDRDTPIRAKLQAVATQAIADSSTIALLFDTDVLDDDNGHSTAVSTSKYFAARAGWFAAWGTANHGASTAGTTRNVEIAVNGTQAVGGLVSSGPRPGGTGAFSQTSPVVLVNLVVGDYVELRVVQNSGGSVTTQTGSVLNLEFKGE